ncbi:MAG: hypothetical protein RBR20_04505 [Desulfobacterales bacterium]|jgi:hypothetical protein|nr:hypothetical protein [Desulfobacterales bacterium]
MTKSHRLTGPCVCCDEVPGSPACDHCQLRREFLEQSKKTKAHRADLPADGVPGILARLDRIDETLATLLFEITRLARSMAPK